jgi:hypothetical protein
VDRTLRFIQLNWVVLAYNFNVVILVLINGELSIGAQTCCSEGEDGLKFFDNEF